jgi:Ca-activated chloride channel family protein
MARLKLTALATLLALVALPVPFAAGQSPQSEDKPQEISTTEVYIPVMVFDKKGEFVTGLRKENFRIYEDGKEQTIKQFDAPTALPLNIAVLIDTSSSVKRKLKFEQDAAGSFILSILERKTDRALFATFDSEVKLHVDFSRDSGDLTRAIDGVKAGGNTRLYDAVYRVCEEKMSQLPAGSRPVMLLVTDGADVGSDRSLEDAISMAQRTNVTVFAISTRNYSDINAGTVRGSIDKELDRLCNETGGRTFLPYQRLELEKAFAGVSKVLRDQYVLYYEPTNEARDGKFRKIEVKVDGVDEKTEVRAKKGYYANPVGTGQVPR